MASPPRTRGTDVTIRDIADELGMSHATVSRALHDHAAISAPTKARVREAAQRLGYIPNSGARALRQTQSRLIGVIFPDIQNDFYSAAMASLSSTMREANYELVLAVSHDDADIEAQHVRSLREARVAGVIIAPSTRLQAATAELLAPLPVVQLLRRHPLLAGPVVGVDEQRGIARGVAHLATRGHRRIAYIGGPVALSTGLDRLTGYRDGLRKAGIAPDESLVMLGDPRPEFGQAAIEKLMQHKDPPTRRVVCRLAAHARRSGRDPPARVAGAARSGRARIPRPGLVCDLGWRHQRDPAARQRAGHTRRRHAAGHDAGRRLAGRTRLRSHGTPAGVARIHPHARPAQRSQVRLT